MCIEVKLTTDVYPYADAKDISWSFGPCDSDRKPNGEQEYEHLKEYNQTCCFNTSPDNWVFELKCKESEGLGWDTGFITINDQRYCDNFGNGFEKSEFVESNPSKYFSLSIRLNFKSFIKIKFIRDLRTIIAFGF